MNVFHQYIAAGSASPYEHAATAAYEAGLQEARLDADVNRVHAYAHAVAALQVVPFAAAHVAWLSEEGDEHLDAPEPETPGPQRGQRNDECQWTN